MTGRHSGEAGSWDTEVLRRLAPSADQDPPSETPRGNRHAPSTEPQTPEVPAEPQQQVPASSSPWDSRLARRLARRHGTAPWRRRLRVFAGVLRSDDEPERRARAVAQCQTAVSTGRRVAVVSAHGGAGGTTLTVGLGLTLAAIRNDAVAVVAGRDDRQVLQHRLGCPQPTSTRAVRDLLVAHRSDPNIASLTHLAVPGAPGLAAVTHSDDPVVVAEAADHLSRRHAVTIVDTGPVPDHPVLAGCHGVVVVGRLALDGVALVDQVLGELLGTVPARRLHVVLMESGDDTGLDPASAVDLLHDHGVPVAAVPSDPHLAAGAAITLPLLSDPASVALTEIAARTLDIATTRS